MKNNNKEMWKSNRHQKFEQSLRLKKPQIPRNYTEKKKCSLRMDEWIGQHAKCIISGIKCSVKRRIDEQFFKSHSAEIPLQSRIMDINKEIGR